VSPRLRLALAGAFAAVVGTALAGWMLRAALRDDGVARGEPGTAVAAALESATAAGPPFPGLTETRVALGGACLRVVVADEHGERVQGLRGVRDLGPYDGMLFVFASDSESRFTMADTPLPLDIGWYGPTGLPVGRARMESCPGDDDSCPDYAATTPFRYALETEAGALGGGPLGSCA
jgi:uncharacterized membrane protein (UPF0127 family)